ncbi:MAG TPA: DUF6635 family protein [Stellaceae bacterium]|nr:DUF6635 family protein [Stellaceae bacterium]
MSDFGSSDTWTAGSDGFARSVVTEAMRGYFRDRHVRIAPFVERHFSVAGSAALHRKAIGWDLLRAPANLVLAVPYAGSRLTAAALQAAGARRAADRVRSLNLLLQTAVGQEIRWLVMTELLELPWRHGNRVSSRDALAEVIVSEPRVEALARQALAAVAPRGDDPQFRLRLESALATYTETRAAAAEVATTIAMLGTGALGVHQVTPGVMTLGPALAAAIAQQTAISSFPLGSTLGTLWYGAFPVAASPALVAGLTGGLMLGAAALSAFAGIVTDPVQRRLGLHQRRLERLLDALERQWIEGAGGVFVVRDHYVARLLGLLDILGSVWRVARS